MGAFSPTPQRLPLRDGEALGWRPAFCANNRTMPRAPFFAATIFATLLAGCAALGSGSSDGRDIGELCVSRGGTAPNCGPVQVSRSKDRVKLRVADMTYDLKLEQDQLDLTLIQGTTLIDTFSAPYAWNEQVLRFVDVDRQVFYQVRFGR